MQAILLGLLLNIEKLWKKNLTAEERGKVEKAAELLNEVYRDRYEED